MTLTEQQVREILASAKEREFAVFVRPSDIVALCEELLSRRAADAAVREAAEELLDTLRPSMLKPFSDPAYGDEIRAFGKRIGFGALMAGAEAEWRISAKASGNPDGGEFVAGPCRRVLTHDVERLRGALKSKASP